MIISCVRFLHPCLLGRAWSLSMRKQAWHESRLHRKVVLCREAPTFFVLPITRQEDDFLLASEANVKNFFDKKRLCDTVE